MAEYTTIAHTRGITVQLKHFLKVRYLQKRKNRQGTLQSIKTLLCGFIPLKGKQLQSIREWYCNSVGSS